MLPEKLCHVEKMAPGTAANGNMAKCVAARDVARPEFCIPTSMEIAVRLSCGNPIPNMTTPSIGVMFEVLIQSKELGTNSANADTNTTTIVILAAMTDEIL